MKWLDIIRLSFKNILFDKTRSLLAILGIVLGVAFIIVLVSLEFGLRKIIYDQVLGSDSSRVITVTSERSKLLRLTQEDVENFKSFSGVETVKEVLNFSTKVSYRGFNVDVSSYGVPPGYFEISNFKIIAGSGLSQNKEELKQVIINESLAKLLGLKKAEEAVGQEISLSLVLDPNISSKIKNTKVVSAEKFKIQGVIGVGNNPILYLPIENLYQNGGEYLSKVKVVVSDLSEMEDIRYRIEQEGFQTRSVQDAINELNRIFDVIKILLASVSSITLFIAVTSILNTLFISIIQRTAEVGFMRIIGIRTKDIKLLLITEAVMLSLSGTVGGLLFGELFNYVLNMSLRSSGRFDFLGESPAIACTPVYMVILILILAVLIGLITGFYPAQRAIKINPLEALRKHK